MGSSPRSGRAAASRSTAARTGRRSSATSSRGTSRSRSRARSCNAKFVRQEGEQARHHAALHGVRLEAGRRRQRGERGLDAGEGFARRHPGQSRRCADAERSRCPNASAYATPTAALGAACRASRSPLARRLVKATPAPAGDEAVHATVRVRAMVDADVDPTSPSSAAAWPAARRRGSSPSAGCASRSSR